MDDHTVEDKKSLEKLEKCIDNVQDSFLAVMRLTDGNMKRDKTLFIQNKILEWRENERLKQELKTNKVSKDKNTKETNKTIPNEQSVQKEVELRKNKPHSKETKLNPNETQESQKKFNKNQNQSNNHNQGFVPKYKEPDNSYRPQNANDKTFLTNKSQSRYDIYKNANLNKVNQFKVDEEIQEFLYKDYSGSPEFKQESVSQDKFKSNLRESLSNQQILELQEDTKLEFQNESQNQSEIRKAEISSNPSLDEDEGETCGLCIMNLFEFDQQNNNIGGANVTLDCGHQFHLICILNLFSKNPLNIKCPHCKEELTTGKIERIKEYGLKIGVNPTENQEANN